MKLHVQCVFILSSIDINITSCSDIFDSNDV